MPRFNPTPSLNQAPVTYGAPGVFQMPPPSGTDDTAVFNAVIAQATLFGKGDILLDPGTYFIAGTATGGPRITGSNIEFIGAGPGITVIKSKAGVALNSDLFWALGTVSGSSTNLSNIGFRDLTIDCSTQTAGSGTPGKMSTGLNFFNVDNVRIQNVEIKNTGGYGIQIQSTDQSHAYIANNPIVAFCKFVNCGRVGGGDSLAGGRHQGAQYVYNRFEQCNGTAIDSVYPRSFLFHGNSIGAPAVGGNGAIASDFGAAFGVISDNVWDAGGAISLQGYNPTSDGNIPPQDCQIIGNVIPAKTNAFTSAIYVTASTETGLVAAGNTCTNISIIGNRLDGAQRSALRLMDISGLVLQGNTLSGWNTSATGISITGGGATNITSASDCFAFYLGAGVPGSSNGVGAAIISGNQVTSVNTNQLGLYVEMQGANENIVTGNNFIQGSSAPQIYVTPATTRTLFRGNTPELPWFNGLTAAYPTYAPTLAATGVTMTNNTHGDLQTTLLAGTVTRVNYNGVNLQISTGSLLWTQQSPLIINYTGNPTLTTVLNNV